MASNQHIRMKTTLLMGKVSLYQFLSYWGGPIHPPGTPANMVCEVDMLPKHLYVGLIIRTSEVPQNSHVFFSTHLIGYGFFITCGIPSNVITTTPNKD